ncbi:lim domain family [Anaeramoeba flamelloides]|uniref:Lim domain family n=1 Tax=Anaeramoeba flamelloides TaxID=1746091 RepID=A0AAV7ZZH9_9EUKA|nr:lim domain family [Anaeramoeba flamelloides]
MSTLSLKERKRNLVLEGKKRTCCLCQQPISGSFHKIGTKYYHTTCSETKLICVVCRQTIQGEEMISDEHGQLYHNNCFRCVNCSKLINVKLGYLAIKKKAYCKECGITKKLEEEKLEDEEKKKIENKKNRRGRERGRGKERGKGRGRGKKLVKAKGKGTGTETNTEKGTGRGEKTDRGRGKVKGRGRGRGRGQGRGRGRGKGRGITKPKNERLSDIIPNCTVCSQPILSKVVKALNLHFHLDCFKCQKCNFKFRGSTISLHNNLPYHQQCHRKLFGKKCEHCGKYVEKEFINALEKVWHLKCFKCIECKNLLSGSYIPLDNQPYCESCANKINKK